LLVAVSWLFVENAAMRSRLAVLDAERREIERQGRSSPEPQSSPAAPAIASLIFLPGLTRGRSPARQLALKPTTQIVRMEIQLEERDNYPRFRAELRSSRGEEILTRSNLSRKRTPAGYAVSFDVPSSGLPAGDYELALRANRNGDRIDIGFYPFTVRRSAR
jgi:hypothetical protein